MLMEFPKEQATYRDLMGRASLVLQFLIRWASTLTAGSVPSCKYAGLGPSAVSVLDFAQWGIDLLGNFSVAKAGQNQFLVVAVDYFTKQGDAEPLAQVKASNMEKFI